MGAGLAILPPWRALESMATTDLCKKVKIWFVDRLLSSTVISSGFQVGYLCGLYSFFQSTNLSSTIRGLRVSVIMADGV